MTNLVYIHLCSASYTKYVLNQFRINIMPNPKKQGQAIFWKSDNNNAAYKIMLPQCEMPVTDVIFVPFFLIK